LEDGKEGFCDHFDIVEEYDIINPASLLEDVIAHPGVQRGFTADHLQAVIRNHIVYRFYPNGANVIHFTAEALQPFNVGYMGFIQSAPLSKGAFTTHEYYIPKTIPFQQDGISYDFRSIQDYSFKLPHRCSSRLPTTTSKTPGTCRTGSSNSSDGRKTITRCGRSATRWATRRCVD